MKLTRRTVVKVWGAIAAALSLSSIPASAAAASSRSTLSLGSLVPSFLAPRAQGSSLGNNATPSTVRANAAVLQELNWSDRQNFEDAQRGFIATRPDLTITSADGRPVWDLTAYEFLNQSEAPPTVNPSLWRQAQLNMNNGLFQAADRVYQVRGFDVSNMTIVEGDTGIIVIDPLISVETARAALDLYTEQRGQRPVVAVIYTHSHVDHFGGVRGVVSEADVNAGSIQVLAPDGFLEAAVSENVTAGNAMERRSHYQFAPLLARGERGQVDTGVGKSRSTGSFSLIPPTDVIQMTGERRTIDGVELVFQLAPDTEAPAEMTIYFPQFRVFDSAELACDTLHNVLTLRGAQVRDANKWSQYLNEAITLYGDKTDVVISQHNWPKWGQERVVEFLKIQRDLYKYIHDQTLRLMNQGYTGTEIAEMLELPASLKGQWGARGYYGTLNHNVKSVYQKYLGWFDGNPANLHPLPPVEASAKYVEYMGGVSALMAKARQDYDNGEYRWVAEVMNRAVFAYPDNQEARNLQADALEQLGYQAESGLWRNFYLTGAYELRNGVVSQAATAAASTDAMTAVTLPMYFDYLGVRLIGSKAEGKHIVLNWNFTDVGEQYVLNLENSALTYTPGRQAPDAQATLTLTRAAFDAINTGATTLNQAIASGDVVVDGDPGWLVQLFGMMDTFDKRFNIVTP